MKDAYVQAQRMKRLKQFWWSSLLLLGGLLLMSAVSIQARAQTPTAQVDLSWEAPTEREDGTPIQPEDIASYRIYYTVDGPVAEEPGADHIVVDGSSTDQVVTIPLTPRATPYELNFGARAVDTEGRISAMSNIVTQQFLIQSDRPPAPPTQLRIDVTCSGCTITPVPTE